MNKPNVKLARLIAGLTLLTATGAHAGDEHLVGRWDPPVDWPVVAIHTVLLPDGTVLAYDAVGDDAAESYSNSETATRATVWDPVQNVHYDGRLNLGYNLFCSGAALLPNGHVFIAGGNKNAPKQITGINRLTDFSTFSYERDMVNRFQQAGTMETERWYPALTILANGEVLITGGIDQPSTPEVRQLDGSVRQLSGAYSGYGSERLFNWTKLAPNGKVAYLGPRSELRYLDTQADGHWEAFGQRDNMMREYGSHAMYDVGKVLVAGGGYTATDSSLVVDINSMTTESTSDMNHPRRQHNLTVLLDGTVLATGGFAGSRFDFDYDNAVYEAESWNPQTGQWTRLAAAQVHRGYHSTALLLPDGRVLSAGGGICSGCLNGHYLQKNAEIYSPPYLFKRDGSGALAQRPEITAAPESVAPGQRFTIRVKNPGRVGSVAMIKLGSVTHSTNMEQRYLKLAFQQRNRNRIAVTAPADNNVAPPGHYMLVVCRKAGIPSVARIIQVTGGGAITYAQQ